MIIPTRKLTTSFNAPTNFSINAYLKVRCRLALSPFSAKNERMAISRVVALLVAQPDKSLMKSP